MARKGAPSLYEFLARNRDGKNNPMASGSVPNRAPSNPPPRPTGGIGGSMRMPATPVKVKQPAPTDAGGSATRTPMKLPSWGAIGVAFAVVVVVLVYQIGVSRGSQQGELTAPKQASASEVEMPADGGLGSGRRDPTPEGRDGSGAGGQAQDSSQAARQGAGGSSSSARGTQAASENQSRGAASQDPDLGGPLGQVPKGIDPRQAGLNYFVVASVLEANADKMVQFCRERGLDAWVVPDHNGRLREITVLPGLPKSELEGARAKALKARILKVGLQWKAAGRGNADFSGCYPKLFNG